MNLTEFTSMALARVRATLPEPMTCNGEVWYAREPHRRTGTQVEVSKAGGGGARIQMAWSTLPFEQLATFSIALPGTSSRRYAIVATAKGERAIWFLDEATEDQVFRRDGSPAANRYTLINLRHGKTKRVETVRSKEGIPPEAVSKMLALIDETTQAAVAGLLLSRRRIEVEEDAAAAMKREEEQTQYLVAGCGMLMILAVLGGIGLICAG